MSSKDPRYDRQARLIHVEYILSQNPSGISLKDLADRCEVSTRTVRRDLDTLQRTMRVPIWQGKKLWGIDKDYYLPPIKFSQPEALAVFLAVRLLLSYSRRFDPAIASTFMKLNTAMPAGIQEHIQKTLDKMRGLERDNYYFSTMNLLCRAWLHGIKVKIVYWKLGAEGVEERVIAPYFIEPAASGHSSYVIAFCDKAKEIRTFKVDRIQSIQMVPESYEVPPDFDIDKFLGYSWGIISSRKAKKVKLKFAPELARIIDETVWHPSQKSEQLKDGSVIVNLEVASTIELLSWILSWGEKVEVIEPVDLRQKVKRSLKSAFQLYS